MIWVNVSFAGTFAKLVIVLLTLVRHAIPASFSIALVLRSALKVSIRTFKRTLVKVKDKKHLFK
jgi:hypothetical protein